MSAAVASGGERTRPVFHGEKGIWNRFNLQIFSLFFDGFASFVGVLFTMTKTAVAAFTITAQYTVQIASARTHHV